MLEVSAFKLEKIIMTNNDEKISAYITLFGFELDPDVLTQTLGLNPHGIARKGDIKRQDPRGVDPPTLFDANMWTFVSALPLSALAEEHVEYLLDKLRPIKEKFIELSNECTAELGIEGTIYHPHVGVSVDRHQIRELSELNIELGISVYALWPDRLKNQKEMDELIGVLRANNSIKSFSTKNHDEAQAFANALKAIQVHGENISGALATEISWPYYDEGERREDLLKSIKAELNKLQTAVDKSKYFSS
ncbi:MAG TPA: DUF4279 domain-containing protein [Nevskiaceae bacterium]|nr:DUF4279 domain-containing protein [Nevskiaceae bacterium]